MTNSQSLSNTRSRWSAGFLLFFMVVCMGLLLVDHRAEGPGDVLDPQTASEWLVRAEALDQAGDPAGAERACRAALAREPWHPAAVRKLTTLLLRDGDREALKDWMDDLILGDARLAENEFLQPGFAPYLEEPGFRALFREAQIQARD